MNISKKLTLPLCLAIASLFAAIQTAIANPYQDTLPAWSAVLSEHVDTQGRVNFTALQNAPDKLNEFVAAIETVSPETHPDLFNNRADIISYHINAYNALAMRGVLDRKIPKNFSTLVKRASFFKFRSVTIGGKKTNLLDYENKIIRPLNEPRTHFALNCMVKDCPRLPQTPFTAENLETELQQAALEFFNKEKHVQLNSDKQQVWLSGIMKFYTKDYVASGKKQDLIAYVNQYRETPIPEDYNVKFLKYDWTVNQQPSQ